MLRITWDGECTIERAGQGQTLPTSKGTFEVESTGFQSHNLLFMVGFPALLEHRSSYLSTTVVGFSLFHSTWLFLSCPQLYSAIYCRFWNGLLFPGE